MLQHLYNLYVICVIYVIIEIEKINEISSPDILVKRCLNNSFLTPIYRRKTFPGLYTK